MKILSPLAKFAEFAVSRLRGVARRAVTFLPWNQGGPLNPSRVTADQALSLIPFFACVRILAEQISSLPMQTFRRNGDVRQRITDPQLVINPAAMVDPVTWKRQMVISLAMRGNAVGWISEFDGLGFATSLEWLHPDDVFVDETRPTQPQWYWQGQPVPRERIVHIPWFVQPSHVWGLSPIAAFAASIGIGLETTQFGSSWFEHGGTPPATFKNTRKVITRSESDEIGDRLAASMRRRRPLVYGSDWEFNALSVTPEESQFIQTMRMNATQMAAVFGIPPEWVGGESGGSLTYDNPEMSGRALTKFTLRPWFTLIETVLTRLLPERQYVRFNADAIQRADQQTRYEAYKIAIDAGFLTLNEVRELEELEPLPRRDLIEDMSDEPVIPERPTSRVLALSSESDPVYPDAPSRNGHRKEKIHAG